MRRCARSSYLAVLGVAFGVLLLNLGVARAAVAQSVSPEQAAVDELNQIRVAVGLDPANLYEGGAASQHAHYVALNHAADLFHEDPALRAIRPKARRSRCETANAGRAADRRC
jgi:hypothetical protein